MIYFIHNPEQNSVKIGTAEDPRKRFRALQTANSNRLVLLGVIPGNQTEENKLHRVYRSLRIRGEWFRATPELLSQIRAMVDKIRKPFLDLAELEPGLMDLYHEAEGHHPPRAKFCANEVWYGYSGEFYRRGIKARLIRLVGWLREDDDPRLSTMEAYNCAYQTIYEALPDCEKGCVCQMWMEVLC